VFVTGSYQTCQIRGDDSSQHRVDDRKISSLQVRTRSDLTLRPQTEYHTICAQAIGRLLASIKKTAIEAEDSHDSAPSSPSTHGTQIGRYTNATHWKDGISASIYRALDPSTNLTVALKVTTPALMIAPHDSVREARILTASKHPNIIPLLEAFQHQERFTLAFPFIPYDLSTLLHKSLSPSTQRLILHSLFSALSHLHTLSIIHRDIKPSNILLPSLDGPAYLADFGTAHSPLESSEPPLQKHTEVGTTSYRPPELLFGKRDYGCKLDMWSAGCVAAQVLGLGVKTLFDSGDLGSELALVKSVFEQLGTPDEERWPVCFAHFFRKVVAVDCILTWIGELGGKVTA
jgi:cyclin-dependent kinase